MIETTHLKRLLQRIERLETPLVQIWGWPGSGKSALLSAFLAVHEGAALGLSADDLDHPHPDTAWPDTVRWLVVLGAPEDDRLRQVVRRLRPGQHLVFAGERRAACLDELPGAIIPPQELLPEPGEISALWHLLTGETPGANAAERLHAASDGWYRPVQLALESTGGAGLDTATPEGLLAITQVRSFFRQEVLAAFPPAAVDALLAAPEERVDVGLGQEGWRLLEERGLWVEGPERDRMPLLLSAYLSRERRRRAGGSAPAIAITREPSNLSAAPAAPSAFVYSLGFLGAPFARRRDDDGERDLDCRLRRSFQVLAYIGSTPGLEAGREELVEAVWPTEGEHTIERNFHPTLSHLRRALEAGRKDTPQTPQTLQPLLFRGGVYRLNPEMGWEIDTAELATLVEKGRKLAGRGDLAEAVDAWRRAWTLYRGPFLPGHYEPWVTARRETYLRQQLEMLRELGDLYLRLERSEEAMDAYRSILVEDPLQERVHLALMQVYAAQGRRDMVRRQYDRLCTLLLEELGVEPLPETTREYHRLMS